jgi:hypothetical protein
MAQKSNTYMALFSRLIIHTFQLVFSVSIVFFSHNKSVNSIFQPAYQLSRTGSYMFMSLQILISDSACLNILRFTLPLGLFEHPNMACILENRVL